MPLYKRTALPEGLAAQAIASLHCLNEQNKAADKFDECMEDRGISTSTPIRLV